MPGHAALDRDVVGVVDAGHSRGKCLHLERGVDGGLVERAFAYDTMLHATFSRGCVQPGGGWTADPLTRYANAVTKGTLTSYMDPKSKRSYKGRAAVPERYLRLIGASLAAMGKGNNQAPSMW